MNSKNVAFSVLCAVLLSILVFLFIIWNLPDYMFLANEQFFSQNLEGENKIFILGSSHIYALNPILISNELKKNGTYFVPVDSEHFSLWYGLKNYKISNK